MPDTQPPCDRPRLLIVGDGAATTGFARVMEGIFLPLHDRYEIHHLGTNYYGDPHDYAWKIYPARNGGDTWGVNRLLPLVERTRPRMIFILNDIWIQHRYMDELAKLKPRPPVVLYCPIDGGPIDPENIAKLEGVDRMAVYTQFGKSVVDAAVAAQRDKSPEFRFPEVEVIPHGVHTDVFFPLEATGQADGNIPGRLHARRQLFPQADDLQERFIVLNANRNQPRKRIDITMLGFTMFAANKPKSVKLFLHMGAEDLGWDVVQLARRFQIEDRLLMSGLEKLGPSVSTGQLNLIYNACDVGLNTSTAEGWGLTSFEHAATKAAQIVPRHSACAELWSEAGVLLEPAMQIINERILTEGWLVTPESVAAALERLYNDRAELAALSEKAYRLATKPELQWNHISERWHVLFQEVLQAANAPR